MTAPNVLVHVARPTDTGRTAWLIPTSVGSGHRWSGVGTATGNLARLQIRIPLARVYSSRPSRARVGLEDRFRRLTQAWRRSNRLSSSVADMAMHRSYQQIIGLGAAVVPLILAELQAARNAGDPPEHWFWALHAIMGEDPVTPAHRGDLRAMADDWLAWGHGAHIAGQLNPHG